MIGRIFHIGPRRNGGWACLSCVKIKAHDKCFFLPCALDGAHNNTLVCRAF
jgi:hypothetical protein